MIQIKMTEELINGTTEADTSSLNRDKISNFF